MTATARVRLLLSCGRKCARTSHRTTPGSRYSSERPRVSAKVEHTLLIRLALHFPLSSLLSFGLLFLDSVEPCSYFGQFASESDHGKERACRSPKQENANHDSRVHDLFKTHGTFAGLEVRFCSENRKRAVRGSFTDW